MVKVKLDIEGGGDNRSLHIECRRGFRKLLEKVGFKRMPSTKACGRRRSAFDDFKMALETASADDYPILLVDSEAPVTEPPWKHLHARDGWARPDSAAHDQAQLMVQCMETWCVSDRKALQRFLGQQLQESALPPPNDLEERAKADVQQALEHATRECGRDRTYVKGKRSFKLIAELDPGVLRAKLPHFAKLCEVLDKKLTVAPY